MSIGFTEIFLILVVILLLFGSKRIPELAKALGRAAYEFKNAKETLQKEAQELTENAQKAAEAEAKSIQTAQTESQTEVSSK